MKGSKRKLNDEAEVMIQYGRTVGDPVARVSCQRGPRSGRNGPASVSLLC